MEGMAGKLALNSRCHPVTVAADPATVTCRPAAAAAAV